MTQQPIDDQPLVTFLRQHRPAPPPPAPDLEERILAAVANEPAHVRQYRHRRLWIVPPAIAAGVLIAIAGHRLLTPARPSPAEIANLEAFLLTNWDGTVSDSSPADPAFEPLPPDSSQTQ
ncbi:MAG: hypothetical protein KME26_11455 [Oscillatoria princeps RMCB-10]|nr:hypothetical protein [Oscillatoria princeps RMCB-10]